MARNILYIFDEHVDPKRIQRLSRKNLKIWLCPLTTQPECVAAVTKALQSRSGDCVETVPYLKKFDERSFAVKDEFIKFIHEFADTRRFEGKNLKEYFKHPSEDFSLWWLSLVAEKNPLKSNAYAHLISLLTILDIRSEHQCREVWVDIGNPELAAVIRNNARKDFVCRDLRFTFLLPEWIYILLHVVKGLWRQWMSAVRIFSLRGQMKDFTNRVRRLIGSRYLLVTHFPFIDEGRLEQGEFINKFYGPLQRGLERKYKDQISWLAMTIQTSRTNLGKDIALAQKINTAGSNLIYIEEVLHLKNLIEIGFVFFDTALKFISRYAFIKRNFHFGDNAIDIWPIFRKEWCSSFCGTRLAEGLSYYHCFANLFNRLEENTTVIHYAEMHAWEKALKSAASKHKNLKIIGLQHSIVSLLHLFYFNDPRDLEEGNDIQKMPRPHFLACVGRIPLKLFRDYGWEEPRTFTLGPLRFEHLKGHLERKISWREKKNNVVAALPISPAETKELLRFVYQAFGKEEGYSIMIKAHPFCPIESILKSFLSQFEKSVFQFTNTPLEQLLLDSKVLVVTESSSALEGLSCQCRIIIPRLAGTLNLNPLAGISDFPVYVYDPQELRRVTGVLMQEELPGYYERCKHFIENYCEFTGTDADYLERLEKALEPRGEKQYAHTGHVSL